MMDIVISEYGLSSQIQFRRLIYIFTGNTWHPSSSQNITDIHQDNIEKNQKSLLSKWIDDGCNAKMVSANG